ncbi:hypothetical protein CSKR_202744 [Clonorchis sinensis]|uniref:Uncharacterized protein n=1 Tax=Clonorchis sinensis TaxID=79923 RepID=A0A8T1M2L3_CLOSI|nr:hypothetical protein CSKR_202744 [Clonorchis sinensis]
MTLRVSPTKRFLGLKHLLSKRRTVTPSPAPTPRALALRPSTSLAIPVVLHKRISSPSNRATQFPDRILKPQRPLPNPSPYQVPPFWQPTYYLPGIPFRQPPTPPQPPPLPKPGILFGNCLLHHSLRPSEATCSSTFTTFNFISTSYSKSHSTTTNAEDSCPPPTEPSPLRV